MNFFRSSSEANMKDIAEQLTKLFSSENIASEVPSSLESLEVESWKPIQTGDNILDLITFWNEEKLLKREIICFSSVQQLSNIKSPFNGKIEIYLPMNKSDSFEVILHYRGRTKSIYLTPDMLIEELKDRISKLFCLAIHMIQLKVRNNGKDMIEGYVRDFNLKKGDELTVTVNELPLVPVSYCCTFLNTKSKIEEENAKPAIVVPILFQDCQTKRLENLLLFCHSDVSMERLVEMIRTELDPDYFATLSPEGLKKINPAFMSKPALLNLTRAICRPAKQDEVNIAEIPPEILKLALQEEHEKRTCQQTQSLFSQAEKSNDKDWLFVAEKFQQEIADKYHKQYDNISADEFLSALRYQSSEYLPIWKKYNRARRGFLNTSSIASDCPLWNLHTQSYSWLSDILVNKPLLNQIPKKTVTIVVAGSYS